MLHAGFEPRPSTTTDIESHASVAQLVETWLSISVVVDGLGSNPAWDTFFKALFIPVFSILLIDTIVNNQT